MVVYFELCNNNITYNIMFSSVVNETTNIVKHNVISRG